MAKIEEIAAGEKKSIEFTKWLLECQELDQVEQIRSARIKGLAHPRFLCATRWHSAPQDTLTTHVSGRTPVPQKKATRGHGFSIAYYVLPVDKELRAADREEAKLLGEDITEDRVSYHQWQVATNQLE